MRNFSPAVRQALRARRRIRRHMYRVDLPTGVIGLWDGAGDFTHEGCTYRPGGQLLDPGAIEGAVGTTAGAIEVRISSAKHPGLSPTFLEQIESVNYVGSRVLLSWYIADEDGVLQGVIPVWGGVLDTVRYPRSTAISGEAGAVFVCESRMKDLSRAGTSVRSTADQQRFDPTDVVYEHAGVPHGDLLWGGR